MTKKRIIYAINANGHRLGQDHHRAKLTDEQVELIRDLYEKGGVSYRQLAKQFGVHRATIADIVTFRKRSTTPYDYRTVLLDSTGVKLPPKA